MTQTQGCVLCIRLFSCIVSDVSSVDEAAETTTVEDKVDLSSKDTKGLPVHRKQNDIIILIFSFLSETLAREIRKEHI